MSAIDGAAPVHSALDENARDDLPTFVEDKRVIPIVDPELLEVDTQEGPCLLHRWLAEKLAVRLGLDVRTLPSPSTLDDVASSCGASRGRREEAYVRLRSLLKEADFARSPAWCRSLIDEQVHYRRHVAALNRALRRRADQIATTLFVLTGLGAALHLVRHADSCYWSPCGSQR